VGRRLFDIAEVIAPIGIQPLDDCLHIVHVDAPLPITERFGVRALTRARMPDAMLSK